MFLTQEHYKAIKIPVPLETIENPEFKYIANVFLLLYIKDSYPFKTKASIKSLCEEIGIFSDENSHRRQKKMIDCIEWLSVNGYLNTYCFNPKRADSVFEYEITGNFFEDKSKKYYLISLAEYMHFVSVICSEETNNVSLDVLTKVYLEMRYLMNVWGHNTKTRTKNVWSGRLSSVGDKIGVSHMTVDRAIKCLVKIHVLYACFGLCSEDKKKSETIIVDVQSCKGQSIEDSAKKAKEHLVKNGQEFSGWYVLE